MRNLILSYILSGIAISILMILSTVSNAQTSEELNQLKQNTHTGYRMVGPALDGAMAQMQQRLNENQQDLYVVHEQQSKSIKVHQSNYNKQFNSFDIGK